MSKIELILMVIAAIITLKIITELAYIRLYIFMLKLMSEGKLIPENDPDNVVNSVTQNYKNTISKFF